MDQSTLTEMQENNTGHSHHEPSFRQKEIKDKPIVIRSKFLTIVT